MGKKTTHAVSDYPVTVQGRNVLVTDAMHDYAVDKVSKAERFFGEQLNSVAITMDIQKQDHIVDIVLHFGHLQVKVGATSGSMYASVDEAVGKMQRMLHKYKTKIKTHARKPMGMVDINVNVFHAPTYTDDLAEINDEIEEENLRQQEHEDHLPQIKAKETFSLKTLTNDEALMKLELSGESFLLFRGEEDLSLKFMYRREDGDYALVEPE